MNELRNAFRAFAVNCSLALGSPWAFAVAVLLILAWAATGPYFQWSDGWQLVINTGTTIGTFLLVFVLQNTQIRDTKAVNIKLDELLRAVDGARTRLVNVETLPDEEIDRLCEELRRLGKLDEAAEKRRRPAGDFPRRAEPVDR